MRFSGTISATYGFVRVAGCLVFVAACSTGGGAANPSTGYGAPLSNDASRTGAGGGAGAAPSAASSETGGGPAGTAPLRVAINVSTLMQLGSFLTDGTGRTLYVFMKDGPDSSACQGACATAWPAVTVAAGETPQADPAIAARLETFERPDGSVQVAFDRAPLYYFSGDSKPGDTNGQGSGGAWFVAAVSRAGRAGSTAPGTTAPGSPPASPPSAPASGVGYGGG